LAVATAKGTLAAHERSKASADREAEAGALARTLAARFDALEFLEDAAQELLSDANAAVRYRDVHQVVPPAHADRDRAALGELRRVGQEIDDDAPQLPFILDQHWEVVRDIAGDLDALAIDDGFDRHDGFAYQGARGRTRSWSPGPRASSPGSR